MTRAQAEVGGSGRGIVRSRSWALIPSLVAIDGNDETLKGTGPRGFQFDGLPSTPTEELLQKLEFVYLLKAPSFHNLFLLPRAMHAAAQFIAL